MNSRPLGELGGSSTSCCFCTANGGLFERPRAAFFTVVAAVVMPCMTVGMVEATRRKTRFLTVGTDITTKAKPPSAATAFCIYFITIIGAINNREKAKEKPHPTSRPHPSLLKWEGEPHNHLKLSKKELPPLGESMGRGLQ